MKIVTYNVNGIRQRISQFGSLRKLLDSFDADIICFQETKLRRQELTAHLVMADGYESFFSCTRTFDKGRTGYSGVATFCRVKSAFSSTEVALPVAAEEGFTGVVCNSAKGGKDENSRRVARGLEDFERNVLVKVDSEGRCVVTDHGHFVLFNIYGPRAECDDMERVQFKRNFFRMLQKRLEKLLDEGRRIFVVGDLNIAPTAMDRCDAGPDFENNEFRRWFRSILVNSGGTFSDVFRAKHPDRREAYTCWPSNTGAEQFNYGTRIDHILCAGSCLHQDCDALGHSIISCHVKECNILTEYKRWKPGNTPRHRWKGGLGIKLEGSDHAPVCMNLVEIPDIDQHSTPSLSSRYLPVIHGFQQTLGSVLMKRQTAPQVESFEISRSFPDENATITRCSENLKASVNVCEADGRSMDLIGEVCPNPTSTLGSENINSAFAGSPMKKARKSQWSQLSLKSFFQKGSNLDKGLESSSTNVSLSHSDLVNSSHKGSKAPALDDCISTLTCQMNSSSQVPDQGEVNGSSEKLENKVALLEWQRIQQLMQNSIPLCKGHKEPCVARIVKKPGPTFGHRFYVCARAEGPASNPEANCGYFKWASSKFRHKR